MCCIFTRALKWLRSVPSICIVYKNQYQENERSLGVNCCSAFIYHSRLYLTPSAFSADLSLSLSISIVPSLICRLFHFSFITPTSLLALVLPAFCNGFSFSLSFISFSLSSASSLFFFWILISPSYCIKHFRFVNSIYLFYLLSFFNNFFFLLPSLSALRWASLPSVCALFEQSEHQ